MSIRPPPPAYAATTSRKRRAALISLRSGKLVLAVVSLLVLVATGYGWRMYSDLTEGITRTDVFEGAPKAKPMDGAVDILLVGIDSRTDAQGNPLPRGLLEKLHLGDADGEKQTDSMILVHIPQDGESAVAVSFPRDSYVRIAGGYGKHKLNSAYVYAYNDTYQRLHSEGTKQRDRIEREASVAGRKNLVATIEQLIGRPGMIDRYAEVNLGGFHHITKALGGVKVCLNEAVHERNSGVDLEAGVQTISRMQALAFVRQRYGLDDGGLDRVRRQQAFLAGVARELLSAGVLLNPSRLSEIISAIQKSVVLSEGWDLREFAAQMRALTGGDIKFHTMPTEGNATIGGAAVLRVDQRRVRSFIDHAVGDSPSSGGVSPPGRTESAQQRAGEVTVDIYDGSATSGLGKQVRQTLREDGFLGNSYATIGYRPGTIIRYPPGEKENLELLRQALGSDAIAQPDSDIPSGHLRLLLGAGFEQAVADTPSSSPPPGEASARSGASPDARRGAQPPSRDPITAAGIPCVD